MKIIAAPAQNFGSCLYQTLGCSNPEKRVTFAGGGGGAARRVSVTRGHSGSCRNHSRENKARKQREADGETLVSAAPRCCRSKPGEIRRMFRTGGGGLGACVAACTCRSPVLQRREGKGDLVPQLKHLKEHTQSSRTSVVQAVWSLLKA